MTAFAIYGSRAAWSKYLVGALIMIGVGVYVVAASAGRMGFTIVIGWTSILFFACCAFVFVRNLFDRRPRIVFDDHGVLDRTLRVGLIEWADILNVTLRYSRGQPFLNLVLRDTTKYTARLSPLLRRATAHNPAMGFTDLSLNLIGSEIPAPDVEAFVKKELAERSSRAI